MFSKNWFYSSLMEISRDNIYTVSFPLSVSCYRCFSTLHRGDYENKAGFILTHWCDTASDAARRGLVKNLNFKFLNQSASSCMLHHLPYIAPALQIVFHPRRLWGELEIVFVEHRIRDVTVPPNFTPGSNTRCLSPVHLFLFFIRGDKNYRFFLFYAAGQRLRNGS